MIPAQYGGLRTYNIETDDAPVLVHNCKKNQGIYLFRDQANGGKLYVGKTNNFTRRLSEHLRDGRISSPNCLLKIHVCGGDRELFAAEDELKTRLESHGWDLSNKIESPGAKIRQQTGEQLTLFDWP